MGTPRFVKGRKTVIMLALLMALLAGCSSAEPSPVSEEISADEPVVAAPQPTIGPLELYLMRAAGSPIYGESQAESQARIDREAREVEERKARCMAEQGFTYHIAEHPGGHVGGYAPVLPADWPAENSREWSQRFGFGLANNPWEQLVAPPGSDDDDCVWVDPNQEQLDAMSEAERTAWDVAMYGQPLDMEWDPASTGCWDYANDNSDSQVPDQFGALLTEISLALGAIDSDPRIVALNADWSACMAENGHSGFPDQGALHNQLSTDWGVIGGSDAEAAILNSWDWRQYPDGPGPDDLPQPDPAAVAAFAEQEISFAVADYDCRAATRFEQTYLEINHDIQQRIVEQHRNELEAFVLYMDELRN